jgi:hypothetical protein
MALSSQRGLLNSFKKEKKETQLTKNFCEKEKDKTL